MRAKDRTPFRYNARGKIVPTDNDADGWVIHHQYGSKNERFSVTDKKREAKEYEKYENVRIRPFRFVDGWSKPPYVPAFEERLTTAPPRGIIDPTQGDKS